MMPSISGKAEHPTVNLTVKTGASTFEQQKLRELIFETQKRRSKTQYLELLTARKPRYKRSALADYGYDSSEDEEDTKKTSRLSRKNLRRLESNKLKPTDRTERWIRESSVSSVSFEDNSSDHLEILEDRNMSHKSRYDIPSTPSKYDFYKGYEQVRSANAPPAYYTNERLEKKVRFKDRYESNKSSFNFLGT